VRGGKFTPAPLEIIQLRPAVDCVGPQLL
jgi:hypothetical protein